MTGKSKHGNATLEELEQSPWGEPTYKSHLVTECHRLRRVQLRLLTSENLRLLIGQQIGLEFLIPMALDLLNADPLTEGDFYPGDLLCVVLRVDPQHWHTQPAQHTEVNTIALKAQALADSHGKVVVKALAEALAAFSKGGHGSNNALERTARGRTRASQLKKQGPRRLRAAADRGR